MARRLIASDDPGLTSLLMEIENELVQGMPAIPGWVIMRLEDPRGYYVAHALETFDRELRRASAALKQDKLSFAHVTGPDRGTELPKRKRDLYPDPPSASALALVGAERGSSLLLLEPLGAAQDLLNHAPLSALLNAATLSGWVVSLTIWVKRRWPVGKEDEAKPGDSAGSDSDPERSNPEGTTAPIDGSGRQELDALAAADGDPSRFFGEADLEFRMPAADGLTDGGTFRGHREINYVRQDPDGTVTWVTVR